MSRHPAPASRASAPSTRRSPAGRRHALAALLLLSSLAGCGSPNPRLYTLAPIAGQAAPGGPAIVLLREISLARYLDRVQIVRSSENYRVDVMANDWWGEPPAAMLSRVLVEELTQRLPGSSVYGENGAVSVRPDATIELNIARFDKDASGQVVLIAQAGVIRRGRTQPARRNFRITTAPAEGGLASQVEASSRAVGELADGLAAMLRHGA